jgi:hypothetical protein
LRISRPTCPAFGGRDLDRLFISSARVGLSDEALTTQPDAGGIFAAIPGQARTARAALRDDAARLSGAICRELGARQHQPS